MTAREALVLAHILLLVYWLGADLGQFVLSFPVRQASLPVQTRAVLARMMVALDLGPRVCLVMMLPVGLTLAAESYASPVRGPWLAAVWVGSLVWLAAVVKLHLSEGKPAAMRGADMAFRAGLAATLIAVSAVSVATGGPFAPAWLAVKVGIFGVLVALGLGIRLSIRGFAPAFQRLLAEGSTPAGEAALGRSLRAAYPLVIAIWVGLIGAAAIGVSKP